MCCAFPIVNLNAHELHTSARLFPLLNCRFLLDLRQINDTNGTDHVSDLLFFSYHTTIPDSVLGNLGQPLHAPFSMDMDGVPLTQEGRLPSSDSHDDFIGVGLGEVRRMSMEMTIETVRTIVCECVLLAQCTCIPSEGAQGCSRLNRARQIKSNLGVNFRQ